MLNFNQLEHFIRRLKIWLSQGSAGSIPVRGTQNQSGETERGAVSPLFCFNGVTNDAPCVPSCKRGTEGKCKFANETVIQEALLLLIIFLHNEF